MEEITFQVQGSEPDAYTVRFSKDEGILTAKCSCPAGSVGQYCKHRIRILGGDDQGIVSGNEVAVQKVTSWLPGTEVERAIRQVRDAEERLEFAKSELTALKKKLARALVG